MAEFLCKNESYRIIGACLEVYAVKGCGFNEPIYQDCLAIELELQDIPFEREKPLPMDYKGRPIAHGFRPDFIGFGTIIVEAKAVSRILPEHRAKVLNYLHASGLRVGLLVNFGHHPGLEWERIVL